jgi:hypothetical protein
VQANEYEIVSVTLNEIVTNRMLVDTVTTQRLGVARADDTAMENHPLGVMTIEQETLNQLNVSGTLTNQFTGNVALIMPGGLRLSTRLQDYRYNALNGSQ